MRLTDTEFVRETSLCTRCSSGRVLRVIRHREEEIDPSWGRAMGRHRASGPRLDFALTPSLSPGHFGAGQSAVKHVGLL